ncbi:hypothetical protein CDAR_611301 [Caerostris darwini]|uniref:Uncharacterized protein n=1 Tax=Caerostris darwini TaxID=1538125 RepID=A0AAV4UQJ7_9ARAC|nr:hypothetical protein CDAR_611301 [Caerostris darwini]
MQTEKYKVSLFIKRLSRSSTAIIETNPNIHQKWREKKMIFPIFNCDSSRTRLIPSVSEYRSPINGEAERHSKNLSARFKTQGRIQFRKTDSISFEVIAFSGGMDVIFDEQHVLLFFFQLNLVARM